MSEGSRVKVPSPEEFESMLQSTYDDMLSMESKGDYVEADRLRQKAIIDKRNWEESYINDMEYRNQQAQNNLEKDYNSNVEQAGRDWTETIDKYMTDRNQEIAETDKRNRKEIEDTRKTMTEQWPAKVKETYELLNLREMEHHMSKQKE